MLNLSSLNNLSGLGTGSKKSATTTNITPISIKGGVIRNIDQATGDIARTASGFIEDEKYNWRFVTGAGSNSGEFDSAVTRTGRLTAKVSTTNTSGRCRISYGFIDAGVTSTVENLSKYAIRVKPSTSYRLTVYAKTNNAAADSVFTTTVEYTSSGGSAISGSAVFSTKLTGTNDWTKLETTWTTKSTAEYLGINLVNNVTGNISDAWFDVNSMTLEEVATITNPTANPVKLYPSVTAVSSTDNIDQSQVTVTGQVEFGNNGTRQKAGSTFVPTKTSEKGFTFQKTSSKGTYTGDVTVSIQATTGGLPNGTVLGTKVYTNAQWEALTNNADTTVLFDWTPTIGSTYAITFESSTQDANNCPRVNGNSGTPNIQVRHNGTIWSTTTGGHYFKTLYSKNTTNFTVRTDTETLSVTAPTVEGWANGTVIDTKVLGLSPITLASGANTVYLSSNGSPLADSDTDESLQATLGGRYAS